MCKKEKTKFKYLLKEDGREIKMGDKIRLSHKEETPLGEAVTSIELIINKDNIDKLIEYDYVTKESIEEIPMKWGFYAKRLGDRMDLTEEQIVYILTLITHHLPAIAFQMLLKEISLYMEKEEGTPVMSNDEYYTISIADGSIYGHSKKYLSPNTNVSNFSVFSSRENAEKALQILEYFANKIYGKQENS